MVITRSQKARGEQPSPLVASPGANPPRRRQPSRQRSARVVEDNDTGGRSVNAAGRLSSQSGSKKTHPTNKRTNNATTHSTSATEPKKCNIAKCKNCNIFTESRTFERTYKKKVYEIINTRKCQMTCTTTNIIYLITCNKCNIQYVGETIQTLAGRQSDHKSRIRTYNTEKQDTKLVEHFNFGTCKGESYRIMIIETIEGSGRDDEGKMDKKQVTHRRKREDF